MADPVVPENPRIARYVVTNPAGQDEFVITFPVVTLDDGMTVTHGISVYIDDEPISADDYTVDLDAGKVTLDTPADLGQVVVLQGATPLVRLLAYALRGGPPSSRLNQEFNSLYYLAQEINTELSRKVGMVKSSAAVAPYIGDLSDGQVIVYDAATNSLVNGPDAAQIAAAEGYATEAEAFAAAAEASDTSAAAHVATAAASALEAANYAAALTGTSASSLAIGTGSKSFTTQTGKQFTAGAFIAAVSQADNANYMHGTVTSYDSGTGALVVSVTDIGGSGTLADWALSISGSRGATGPTGPTGAGSGDVSGPAESVDSEMALFDSVTGQLLKRATGSGYVKVASGVMQTPAETIPLADLAAIDANTVLANATADSAAATAIALAVSQLLGRGASSNIAAITIGSGLTMTGDTLSATAGGGSFNAGTGEFTIPIAGSNLLLKIGIASATASLVNQTVSFSNAFPTACLGVVTSLYRTTSSGGDVGYLTVKSFDRFGFITVYRDSRIWFALGY